MLNAANPAAIHASERRGVPALAIRRGTAPDRAAGQGRRRPRDRVRRVGELGSPRESGRRHRSARRPAGRSRAAAFPPSSAISATACTTLSFSPCRSSAGRWSRMATAAPTTATETPCWCSAEPSAAAVSMGGGPVSRPSSGTTAATSPSPPTSARVFAEVLHGHLGMTNTTAVFPGFTEGRPLGMF